MATPGQATLAGLILGESKGRSSIFSNGKAVQRPSCCLKQTRLQQTI
jgi:hypothetical protein